jgi:hypothetical protein
MIVDSRSGGLRLRREGRRPRAPDHARRLQLGRHPRIVGAARKSRVKQFVIDGKVVMLGVDASLNRRDIRR